MTRERLDLRHTEFTTHLRYPFQTYSTGDLERWCHGSGWLRKEPSPAALWIEFTMGTHKVSKDFLLLYNREEALSDPKSGDYEDQ